MIKLGDKVKDKVSGFSGIATAKTEWLNKCVRINITAQKLKDGKPVDEWFDEDQIVRIGNGINGPKKAYTGGARHCCPRRKDAARM